MSASYCAAVIGKNFGDEGKGLAADWLCRQFESALCVRHNGGAQSGHTVELPGGTRFVFHELASGSFRRADTLWADSFMPDLYKLSQELNDFYATSGFRPRIFADEHACATCIDDILINMALEQHRGRNRHGSCGMGINEADLRSRAGFALPIHRLCGGSASDIARLLQRIRADYLPDRLNVLHLCLEAMGEYGELLKDPNVPVNAAEVMARAADQIIPVRDIYSAAQGREAIIFEGGQGLLLDAMNQEYAPHVTASRTGLFHPMRLASQLHSMLSEVIYVTRSYVTRHGAGPLPLECARSHLGIQQADLTNLDNPWQGSIRYAKHPTMPGFLSPVLRDLNKCGIVQDTTDRNQICISLLITHLNETNGCLLTESGDIPVETFEHAYNLPEVFNRVYTSSSPFSEGTAPVRHNS